MLGGQWVVTDDPEVGDADAVVADQEVVELEVAVDEAEGVSGA